MPVTLPPVVNTGVIQVTPYVLEYLRRLDCTERAYCPVYDIDVVPNDPNPNESHD